MSTDTDASGGDVSLPRAREILDMSQSERDETGVTDERVQQALYVVIQEGSKADKRLGDVTLPALEFEYEVLEGVNNHPLDLTGARIESLDLARSSVRVPLVLDEASVGDLRLEYGRFERDVTLAGATVEAIDAHETVFEGNFDLPEATISGPFDVREADFRDDMSFDGAVFEGEVTVDAADLYGESNRLEDNASIENARFEGPATFRQTDFGFTEFGGATFHEDTVFTEARFDGDADFSDATFESTIAFDECRIEDDADFSGTTFEAAADFRGAEFRGGARAIEDDATFADATFHDDADFSQAQFRYVDFEGATFEGEAVFETAVCNDDADFLGVTFEALADFDEARFLANADFSDTSFVAPCDFRGAEFHGGANHLDVAATFRNVDFGADADFDNALFGTAAFEDVVFADLADFRGATFEDTFTFAAEQRTNEAYVDFSHATLKDGEIVQPEGGWVRYDLTGASIGSVALSAPSKSGRRELLDYFRVCETEFNEFDSFSFDFSEHTDYLDRNDWVLHEFDAPPGYEPTVEMTPETIERTYLKAKIAASAVGNQQAAGEFRVKRQEFARRKYWGIVGDASEGVGTRLRNAARALENRFLGISCGHGLRLTRIVVVFALFPLIPALLYTYGGLIPGFSPDFFATVGVIDQRTVASVGEAFTAEGLRALYANLSFAYITFLTIGYGNAAPKGGGANVLAAGSVYVSVILGGLVLYALIKRSEV